MKRIEDIHICVNSSDGTHSVERTIPLAEKGFKISFIAHEDFDRLSELRKYKNITIYLLNEIKPGKRTQRLIIYIELIKSINPDLIIVHFCGYDRFQAAVFSGIKPIIGILMGGDVDTHSCTTPLSTYIEFKLTKLFLPHIELLAAKTNKIIKMLESWNLHGKIVHIPWGVKINSELGIINDELIKDSSGITINNHELMKRDDEKKKELRKELGLPEDKFLVLSNRNVSESGRQLEILQGFHKLVKEGLNVYLLIVVRNNIFSYLTKVIEYIDENKLNDYVKIYDYIPQKEMFNYYYACDVLVSNWRHDGLPQTFFESSLRGLPIIMNDLPQYKDYYTDKESALINDGTSEGFYESLKIIYYDKNLRNEISKNGRNVVVKKADFDKWADYFIEELIKLINSGKIINIPYLIIVLGKVMVVFIVLSRRWPLKKIKVRV